MAYFRRSGRLCEPGHEAYGSGVFHGCCRNGGFLDDAGAEPGPGAEAPSRSGCGLERSFGREKPVGKEAGI